MKITKNTVKILDERPHPVITGQPAPSSAVIQSADSQWQVDQLHQV